MLASLALLLGVPNLQTAPPQTAPPQTVPLRYSPSGELATFNTTLNLEDTAQNEPLRVRWQVGERATPQGENFRLSRYVILATADAPAQAPASRKAVAAMYTDLIGKTFYFLRAPDGRTLGAKLGKYDNPVSGYPSLDLTLPPSGTATVGETWTAEIGAGGTKLPVRASVRSLLPLPGDTAVVVDLASETDPTEIGRRGVGAVAFEPGSYAVLSAKDGRYIFARMAVDLGGLDKTKVTIDVRRSNVPGASRAAAAVSAMGLKVGG